MTHPGSEWRVFRAIQLANFNTPLILDDDANLADALRGIPGIDADQLVAMIDAPEVVEAYRADKDETRKAEGSAAELQGKTATTDGPVRFTAPSIVFEQNGTKLVAGGFQPVEAYDILVANIDPQLHREPPPETPAPLLERFDDGLTTQEVAALMAGNDEAPTAPPPRRRCSSSSSPATRSVIRSATTPCGSRPRPPSRWCSARRTRSP